MPGCCNAVPSKVCGVSFAVKVGRVLHSVFVGLVTQLCSPSNVCVCGVWTHVCIHKANFLSSPRSAQLFCLHCTLVWLFIHKTHLSSRMCSWGKYMVHLSQLVDAIHMHYSYSCSLTNIMYCIPVVNIKTHNCCCLLQL